VETSLEVLGKDGDRAFVRSWHVNADGTQTSVLGAWSTGEPPTAASLDRLSHEYALKDQLDSAWAVRPFDLVRQGDRTVLVFEDPGGEPLERLLGAPFETDRFVRLAISITAALGEVHLRGLVHKDLKPAHILVDESTGSVRLMGFGLATLLPRERQSPAPPETIAGTLAYMAPEQTGRMNRSIDARSDLYSLGVTFYQMLTGTLPFTASEPMEWIHCHIARKPVPPSERVKRVPAQLSRIVMKLLAKTAEERYQTTGGVERDLRRSLSDWEALGYIHDFPLGQQDTPDRLLIPEQLYGREHEVETLLASFDRIVKSGAPELVLVSGYSGIGKSSVVNELHRVLVPPRGLFASGKFDQYKRDIPYATLVQAFQSLIRPLLAKSDTEFSGWRDALLEALGPNGRLMVDLVPELKLIIGEQPPVPELEPQQAQSRFRLVYRRFINVFARPEHPLALFLDDLQWLDPATLDLLGDLLTQSDLQSLMLVGAYRDNEVTASHPLMRTLDAAKAAGGKVVEITIAPLAREHLEQLIGATLRCEPERTAPLAQLVHEKTAGNPFFVIQFLNALADEELLTFHPETAQWFWDLNRAHAMGYTGNIADLMAAKLTRLPADTQTALQLLACLGNTADIATFSLVSDISEQGDARLLEAVRQDLVQRLDTAYRFTHDRVQEIAYSLIPERERAAVHLLIGRRLLERTRLEELDEKLFDIVNHLNAGVELITDPAERAQLADLNAAAGRRARASVAYATARNFFAAGAALLPEESWDSGYDFKLGLFLDWAESEYLRGDFEAAEALFQVLLANAKSDLDQAAVYELRLKMYQIASKYDDALSMAVRALQLFGVELPPNEETLRNETQDEAAAVKVNLRGRDIADLANAQEAVDRRVKATITLLANAIPVAYLGNTPQYFPLITLKLVNFSLKFGHTKESCVGYTSYAIMLVSLYDDPHSANAFAKMAIKLNDKLGDITRRGTILHHYGDHINFWLHPIATDFPILEKAFLACMEAGDFVFAGHIAFEVVWQAVERGDRLEDVLNFSQRYADFARGSRNDAVYQTICLEQQFVRCLMGQTLAASSFSNETLDEMRCIGTIVEAGFTTGQMFYHTMKLLTAYLMGDDAAWRDHAEGARRTLPGAMSMPMEATFYFVHALVLARTYREAADANRDEILKTLTAYEQKLRFWAENCRENFSSKHALVAAEIAEIRGDKLSAEDLFEQAIESAKTNGFFHWEGMANEAAARFYAARGLNAVALALLRNAHRCYVHWGASGKVRQLDRLYPQLRDEPPVLGPTGTIRAPLEHLDLATVLKVSQAVSGEILLDKLLDTLMRSAIEHAGAERGLLILSHGIEQRIVAEAITGGDTIVVQVRDQPLTATALCEAFVQTVLRTQEAMILDDAAADPAFAADPYIRQRQARSILCLPLVNQSRLIGVLYLENNLAPRVFTPTRIAVLRLVASQAAISLENALLYADLQQENSERKRAEEALREREGRIRRLVDSNIIGLFFWNLAGDATDANDAFLQIVGYSREDLLSGKVRWDHMTPPEYRAADARSLEELRQAGTSRPYEKEYIRKDGRRIPVLIGCALVEGSQENGVAFVLDLSERKEAEAERAARRVAEAANQAKNAFLANMSHELRTPLNGILGYAQILRRDPNLGERQIDNVNVIQHSGEQLLTLINDILDFAKIEAGKLELSVTDIALAKFLRLIVEIIDVKARQKGLEFICEVAPPTPRGIRADEGRLRQVLLNLLTNAVKFTDRGRVSLRVRFASPSRLLFEVHDTGIGVNADHLETIFQPFEQVSDAQRRLGGAGLGLAISRRFVRLMGSDIKVTSQVGAGSTFWFELDVPVIEAETLAAPERLVTGYKGPPKKVLVVDDVAANRAMAVDMLRPLGFDVVEAVNGTEALHKAQAARPDWILMDMVMPEMDGLEATRRLRQLPGLKSVPIIAMSASASDSDERKSLAAGANAFVPKPIDVDQLLTHIATLLKLHWTYELPAASSAENEAVALLVAPPRHELETLHNLARRGNMRAIMQWAERVAGLDARYRPVADQLRLLAKGYQSKAILTLVERYLASRPGA
jgi:PAS domain S-box-containing protein